MAPDAGAKSDCRIGGTVCRRGHRPKGAHPDRIGRSSLDDAPPQAAIGFDCRRCALGDIGAHELHCRRHEAIDVRRWEIPHLRKRIHPSGEEHFGLVDVADAGDGRLIQQCVCNFGLTARHDAGRRLGRVEAVRQGIRSELANLP